MRLFSKFILLALVLLGTALLYSCKDNPDKRDYSFFVVEYSDINFEINEPLTISTYEEYKDLTFSQEILDKFSYPGDFFNSYNVYLFTDTSNSLYFYTHYEVSSFSNTNDGTYDINLKKDIYKEDTSIHQYLICFEIRKLDQTTVDKIADGVLDFSVEYKLNLEIENVSTLDDEYRFYFFFLDPDNISFDDKSAFISYQDFINFDLLSDEAREHLEYDESFFANRFFLIIKNKFSSSNIGAFYNEYRLRKVELVDLTLNIEFTKSASIINRNLIQKDVYVVFEFPRKSYTNIAYNIIDI
ncbi:MAG: hypothetical protein LBV58_02645 [Acholeplasmatales bacterium]|jgi:hypothetical protein|nr:hypothetical protein [Acholeplasmatales bacterium]